MILHIDPRASKAAILSIPATCTFQSPGPKRKDSNQHRHPGAQQRE